MLNLKSRDGSELTRRTALRAVGGSVVGLGLVGGVQAAPDESTVAASVGFDSGEDGAGNC